MFDKMTKVFYKLIADYKWFVFLFFILRLYGITDPPLEIQHNWRQATGLMIARNFLTIDANIFYPRVNENCGYSNIIAGEFQLLSYFHYLVSLIFGYEHWYGRWINLSISSLGCLSFGYLISNIWDRKIARDSVLALLASCWFIYSRKMMPDTFCISLVMISFYFAYQYWNTKAWYHLFIFFIFLTLGGLSKIPAVIYYVIPLYLLHYLRNKTTALMAGLTLISAGLVFIWYFVWGPYISQTYGNWTNLGQPILIGVKEILSHPYEVMNNFVFNSFNSYIIFGLFIFGAYKIYQCKVKYIKQVILFIGVLFIGYIFKAGLFFYHHNYYMIPNIPLMAFILGYGLNDGKHKLLLFLFFIGVIESIANQQHDLRIKHNQLYKLELESILDKLDKTQSKGQILINTQSNPQQLYLANRVGCYIHAKQMQDSSMLCGFKSKGYRWIVIDKTYEYLPIKKENVYEDANYLVYKL